MDLQGLVEKDWIKKAADEIACDDRQARYISDADLEIRREYLAEVIGRNVPDGAQACLLCHWESDEEKREHLPAIADAGSGVYVCGECVGRTKTVTNFGLTVTELGKVAAEYKSKLESRPVQQPAQLIAAQQAEDEGLWCIPKTAMEGHLQKELRRLTEAVEGKTSAECLRELLLKPPVQQPATEPLLEELRKARTVWHKDFGVPVSFPYARFLDAIGAIEDALAARHVPPPVPLPDVFDKLVEKWEEVYDAFTMPCYKVTKRPDAMKGLRQCIEELKEAVVEARHVPVGTEEK